MVQNRLAECSPPACLSSADSSARAEPETEAACTGKSQSKSGVKVKQSRQSSIQRAMQHTALVVQSRQSSTVHAPAQDMCCPAY